MTTVSSSASLRELPLSRYELMQRSFEQYLTVTQQGLAKGSDVPSAPSAAVSWHNETATAPSKSLPTAPSQGPDNKDSTAGDERPQSPKAEATHEEIGWGNEDDGMGPY